MTGQNPNDDDSSGSAPAARYLAFSGMGLVLVASVAVGIGAGTWLDSRLGTGPWLTALGLLLGAAAGFFEMWRMAERLADDN